MINMIFYESFWMSLLLMSTAFEVCFILFFSSFCAKWSNHRWKSSDFIVLHLNLQKLHLKMYSLSSTKSSTNAFLWSVILSFSCSVKCVVDRLILTNLEYPYSTTCSVRMNYLNFFSPFYRPCETNKNTCLPTTTRVRVYQHTYLSTSLGFTVSRVCVLCMYIG